MLAGAAVRPSAVGSAMDSAGINVTNSSATITTAKKGRSIRMTCSILTLPILHPANRIAPTGGVMVPTQRFMKRLKKVKLLILDEWLLYPLKENEARDVLELVEARSKVSSTIFCSQFDVPGWHALESLSHEGAYQEAVKSILKLYKPYRKAALQMTREYFRENVPS